MDWKDHLLSKNIREEDITGIRIDDEHIDSASTSCRVHLESFPFHQNRRQHSSSSFLFDSLSSANDFYTQLQCIIQRRTPPHLQGKKSTGRVLLLSNPFSGQGKSKELWKTKGEIVMKSAGIEIVERCTEYAGHASIIMKKLNIDEYDAVLVNSGDGLVSEVITGLILRCDRGRSLLFPISHIPGGTSNALAATICYACNEPFSPRDVFITESALMITRPRYLRLPLYIIETQRKGIKPMFMSATWGLLADIDIGSERFRWIGMIRFHLEATIRILQLPSRASYSARVSYIPVNDKELSRKTRIRYDADRKLFGKGHFNYKEIDDTLLETMREVHYDNVNEAMKGTERFPIPSLNEKLDDRWKTFEGEWIMINVTSLSHLGSDTPYIPSARIDDEIVYLTLIDWKTIKNRFDVAWLFITMDTSNHLTYPCLQIIPARAVRIEPIGTNSSMSHFAVDGEFCDMGGSSFQVVPSKLSATIVGRNEVTRSSNILLLSLALHLYPYKLVVICK